MLFSSRAQANRCEETFDLSALPFYNEDLETGPGKACKSRRRRIQDKFQHTVVTPLKDVEPELPIDFEMSTDITEMQKSDLSLVTLFQKARTRREAEQKSSDEYVLKDGILYRQQGSVLQLVVPQAMRNTILTLGHSVPWAGHLGKHKTTARIHYYFHWPGLREDVVQFCRSCPQCQITSSQMPSRAPLQPLPIIGTPFERLRMDIVGPVGKSKSGNRYMLVITDYATKWVQIVTLVTSHMNNNSR